MGEKSIREGFWKKHGKTLKNGSENDRFWDAKTFQNYALCNEFMTPSYSEKIRKSMPKWLPKVMENR